MKMKFVVMEEDHSTSGERSRNMFLNTAPVLVLTFRMCSDIYPQIRDT